MSTRIKRLRFNYAKLVEESSANARVEVSLSFAERVILSAEPYRGEGIGQLRAAAMATLTAVQKAMEGQFTCRLADLDHVHALGKHLIAVLVDIHFEGKDVQVFGSCPIQESELDAAAKAVLNATNRFVELASRD